MDLIKYLREQMKFSKKAFGPYYDHNRIINHIKEELIEIEVQPDDLEEWIDVIILGIEGAWRSGHSPNQIVEGLRAKLKKNKKRIWPDWRTVCHGEKIKHIKKQVEYKKYGNNNQYDDVYSDQYCEHCSTVIINPSISPFLKNGVANRAEIYCNRCGQRLNEWYVGVFQKDEYGVWK